MKPLLSIELMVSNRKDTVYKSIESLDTIRKEIPCELILVDTGCDSDLKEYLRNKADVYLEFEWCNDFAKARNFGLNAASGEWFMFLDDDEWFTDVEELIDFFSSGKYKNYGLANYIQRNYLDFEGTQYSDCWVERIIRRDAKTHFESRIHEYLTPGEGDRAFLHAVAEHYGYVYATDEDKKKHFERNRVLIEEELKENPKDDRLKMQLIQELRYVDDFDEMIRLGKEFLSQEMESAAMPCYYAGLVIGYYGNKDYSNVINICNQMLVNEQLLRYGHAFAKEYLALSEYWSNGNCETIIRMGESYIEDYVYSLSHEDELNRQRMIPFISELFDEVKRKEIYSLIICSGLKRGDYSYLEKYMDELRWGDNHVYVFEDMANVLLAAMEEITDMNSQRVFYRIMDRIWNQGPLRMYFVEQMEERQKQGLPINRIYSLFTQAKEAEGIKKEIGTLLERQPFEQTRPILEQIKGLLPYDEQIETWLKG